ncbi:MAG TPA: ABC transporter substrate-binding protein [Gemmatimonadales bacterium]|nr:ABC transporter substrate-binding protein [Gemmatimonadales bacterium]
MRLRSLALATAVTLAVLACRGAPADARPVVTMSGSALGAEGAVLARQLERFRRLHPEIDVRLQRTPDDATQRHQLYVQWLNARVGDPDVLQLDVVWTPEFAAAGWLLPLDRFHPDTAAFFPNILDANRWRDSLYALPWFVDVGLLYWRTDLMARAPGSIEELMAGAVPPWRIVWQGARYEGLVTVFLEYLGAFGGRILDDSGRVLVDRPEAVRALETMRAQLVRGLAPREVLTWHEEETRFAFQNGEAALMRNWPYAYAMLADSTQSKVAGRFAVATMPASRTAPHGHPTAALGGSPLAINAWTEHPREAWLLLAYLVAPEQMLERARVVGQFPTRTAVWDDPRLAQALRIPVAEARAAVTSAMARPATPVYTELSDLLQVQLHRALAGQAEPAAALHTAARDIDALLERTGVRAMMRGAPVPGATR